LITTSCATSLKLRGKKKALEIIPSSIANCTLDNKVIRKSGDQGARTASVDIIGHQMRNWE